MVARIALLAGSVAAAAVLAVALAAAGFAPGASVPPTDAPVATAAEDQLVAADLATPQATPQATIQVDTVYVQPAPPPKVIRVVRTAKPTATRPPVVARKVVKAASGRSHENEGENESEDD